MPLLGFVRWILNAWEPGTLHGMPARRRIRTRQVEFLLWAKGDQGRPDDYWIEPFSNSAAFKADR